MDTIDNSDISGRVAIVTGGTAGIGLGVCVTFAKLGSKVLFTGRSKERGEKAKAEILSASGCPAENVVFFHGDVSEEENAISMIKTAVSTFGKLDFLINNAGIAGENKPLVETTTEDFSKIMQVNVFGVFYCMKHGIIQLKSQGPPEKGIYAVVNMASIAGVMSFPNQLSYAASKHAIIGMTRAVAREVAKEKINVNAMCPGAVKTAMADAVLTGEKLDHFYTQQAIGRMGTPEEIAHAVVFACTNAFMMGHAFVLDGCWTCY